MDPGTAAPAWYLNLRRHPDVTVRLHDGRTARHRAREAEGAEREALWAKAVKFYPGYAAYQGRTARRLPVVVLKPAE